MSDKEARVRLNLQASNFLTALQTLQKEGKGLVDEIGKIGEAAQKSGSKFGVLREAIGKSFKGGYSELKSMGGELKNLVAHAATLGGALGIGSAANSAMDTEAAYKNLANQISAGTGKAMHWREVQELIEPVSEKWGQSNHELAESFSGLWEDIGDVKFATAGIQQAAQLNRGFGYSLGGLSNVIGALNEKFDITAEDLPDAMAMVVSLANKGGVGFEELASKIGIIGAVAMSSGLKGKEGLQKMLGILNIADKPIGGFRKILSSIAGTGAGGGLFSFMTDIDKVKEVEKKLHVKLTAKGKPVDDIIERVLAKTKGDKTELSKVFGGETLKLMLEFGRTYEAQFKATEGDIKTKSAAALAAYHAALQEAGRVTSDAANNQKKAEDRMSDSKVRLQIAVNTFTEAFERPEVVDAIDRISAAMPKLATVLGDVVGFTADFPGLAVAALVGGRVGMSMVAEGMGSMIAAGGGKAAELMGGALTAGGARFAQMFPAFSARLAAVGPALGAAAAVAIVAVLALEAKKWMDEKIKDREVDTRDLSVASAETEAALGSGNQERMTKERAKLQQRIQNAKEHTGGVDSLFAATAELSTHGRFEDPRQKQIREAEKDLQRLDQALSKGAKGSEQAGDAMQRVARATEEAANQMKRLSSSMPGGATNGLPGKPSSKPGADY
jgi:hypothetical protein